jgi:hypothetical protein
VTGFNTSAKPCWHAECKATCSFNSLAGQDSSAFEDGEVIGLHADGAVVQWSTADGRCYRSGESLESFGVVNMSARERDRVGATL